MPLTTVQGSLSSSGQASPGASSSGWDSTVKCFPNPCVLEIMVQPYQQAHSTRKRRWILSRDEPWSCPYHRAPTICCNSLISKLLHRNLLFLLFPEKNMTKQFLSKQFFKKWFVFQLKEKNSLKGNITSQFVLLSSRDAQSKGEICRSGAWSAASPSKVKAPILHMWEECQEARSIFPCLFEKSSYHTTVLIKKHLLGITNLMLLM